MRAKTFKVQTVQVIDNGPSIPDKIMESVLEPMFSTKSFVVGLALSMADKTY